MSHSKMTATEQERLLDALIDGSISDADVLRIEAEMIVDANVRQAFYQRIELDLLLEREAEQRRLSPSSSDAPTSDDGQPTLPRPSWKDASWSTAMMVLLAACLLLAMGFIAIRPRSPGPRSPGPREVAIDGVTNSVPRGVSSTMPARELSASGFAILKGQADADWLGETLLPGGLLPAGPLHLKSGVVLIEFFSGTQMVIEGESQFTIDSAMQMTMQSGKARARVPEPARGFVIKTADGEVVDLGTEFAISVEDEASRVHVIEGEVELNSTGQRTRNLITGQGLRWSNSGNVESIDADEVSDLNQQTISPSEFHSRSESQLGKRFEAWKNATSEFGSDDRLLALYTFDADDIRQRRVVNLRSQTSAIPAVTKPIATDGAIVAAESAVDRWGRVGEAIDFSRLGSRVRVNVPGQHRGLTLNCWVRINSLDRWYNSLFLTDGHDQREPHWQILDDGRVFFSVKVPSESAVGPESQQHVFYSPSIRSPSLIGRWIMLSVVYNVDQQLVTHYVDGSPAGRESIPDFALVENIQLGEASIGNWNEPMYRTDAEFAVRNLNGCMDEFSIHAGALSDQEVLSLYRNGNPHAN